MARPSLIKEEQLLEIRDKSLHGMIDKYEIMNDYKVSMKSAERIIKKLDLMHTKRYVINLVDEYINGASTTELGEKYSMSIVNVRNLLKYRNVEIRQAQYFADFHYFDEIDTEDKAYWLGFIYADGCLHRNSLLISLSLVDVDHLERFKTCIKSNHKIRTGESTGSYSNNSKFCTIEITANSIKEGLEKHGITPAKTYTIKFPEINENLLRHFIRGYVDGDGSFGKYKSNDGYERYSFSMIGTIDFLTTTRETIEKEVGIKMNNNLYDRWPDRETNIRSLSASGKENVISILNWLYGNSETYLTRKFNKYNEIIK